MKEIGQKLKLLAKLNIGLKEFCRDDCLSLKPYSRSKSKKLFDLVKKGNFEGVEKLISEDRFIIYTVDNYQQTPLHWAIKRNLNKIASLLIDHKSNLDSIDLKGRKPLYYAVKNNNYKLLIVSILPF